MEVFNLPPEYVSEKAVHTLFREFGSIQDVRVVADKKGNRRGVAIVVAERRLRTPCSQKSAHSYYSSSEVQQTC